ncbi:phosphatidylinositol N-acetylglucosaminyltransferase subunit P-like [Phragmites australis]|uniref:phosphatidylinositol N-acetylglucosaminyltransferase subunit P-like n=1 Tax=Phragmites australis TaxID=29695 RepID=UPI002D794072|nr:phosphatidylinositol N-acetylglucosaminyltransferase subunit P-like [Phragmites australis]
MEWAPPPPLVVRSPRQTVSLLRNRRPHRDREPSFSSSPYFAARDHGPKPSEVYGFVGSITTVIATAVYLGWAYTPEHFLHSLGITYYPSKYWAVAVPSFMIVAVVLSIAIYMGINFLATPPPTSFNTIFDENSRERVTFSPAMEEERPIEPISDISIDQINNLMFGDRRLLKMENESTLFMRRAQDGDSSNMKEESTSSKL